MNMPTVSQLVNSPLVDISPFSKKATAYLVTVNFMTVDIHDHLSIKFGQMSEWQMADVTK